MSNILSFEELFPESYNRKISVFERSLNMFDKEINDIINESLGISLKVSYIVDKLVEQIEDSIKSGDYEVTNDEYDNIVSVKHKSYVIEQIFGVENFTFDTKIILNNYNGLTQDKIDEISVLNVEANMNYISTSSFILNVYIPTFDFKIGDTCRKVLNHEVMHAWQHHNKNTNKKEKEYPEWRTLYNKSIRILNDESFDTDIETVAKAIYSGDLRELAAFTQQAYYEIKDIGDIRNVDKTIRNLEIYKHMKEISNGINYIEQNGLPKYFNTNITDKKILSILRKRYNQYKKNIARLVIAKKERLLESMTYLDVSDKQLIFMTI